MPTATVHFTQRAEAKQDDGDGPSVLRGERSATA